MTRKSRFASNGIPTILVLGFTLCASFAFPGFGRAQSSAPVPNLPLRPFDAPPLPPESAIASPVAAPAQLPVSVQNNWTPLTNQPAFRANTMLLLTDGRVLVQNFGNTDWHLLTPDNAGSYINGTWSALGFSPMQCFDTRTQNTEPYRPLYFASAVLPDGRVIVIGGEYNFAISNTEVWTNLGEIYDPAAGTWTCLSAPSGWNQLGDAMSVVLPNGTFQLGDAVRVQIATLNLSTNPPTWSVINPPGKSADNFGYNNEEGWTLLPNGTVLALEVWNPADSTSTPALAYSPSALAWNSAGTAPDPLVLISKGGTIYREVGPSLLRPDGTVFASGATGFNDIYDTSQGTWARGPSFPTIVESVTCKGQTFANQTEQFVPADGPAALLPDGNVLVEASPVDNNCKWVAPSAFFEFDGTNLNQVAATPNSANNVSFNGRLLTLPSGQILFTDGSGDVEIYTPTGTPNAAWAPTITNAPLAVGVGGANFKITGTQFNGLSQAVAYGDDYQAATNYPLVRFTNVATQHVFYARTHDHSTMAVATGSANVSTYFDVPANIELGASDLVVVANGIPSAPWAVNVLMPGTTALGSSANPSAVGQMLTFTATVMGTGGTPTGMVTFFDGTTSLGAGTLNASGVATFPTSSLAIGSHSITAQYGGDATFGSTTSTAVIQVVNGNMATAAVTAFPNPSTVGQFVTLSTTVNATAGTPTGTVTFLDGNVSDDGNTLLATATLNGGSATISTSSLAGGSHSITVQYGGDSSFNSATSAAITQVVNPISTTTTLVSSLNPSSGGQSVTFSATVTDVGGVPGTPTGTVIFLDGITLLGTGTLSAAVATFTTSSLATGNHSITARYGGNTTFAVSTSNAVTQVVNVKPSNAGLISSPNPSAVGQVVVFTATVAGMGGTPTGTVTFLDGTTSLGTATLSNGVVNFNTPSLTAGSHSITVSYPGDANFAPSTSTPLTQVVSGKPTTTALVSSVSPSAAGQPVTFTATVSGTGGTPTGTVSFFDSSTSLGTGTLNAGVAIFTTSSLATGSRSISANYGGDSTFAVSSSNVITQIVLKPSAITLASSPNPSVGGQVVTLTATVSGTGGTPVGIVTFWEGSTFLGLGTLSSGMATTSTSTLLLGSHSLTASYGGDGIFNVSASSVMIQTVSVAEFASFTGSPTVLAGQTTIINLTAFQVNGSSITFALSCSGLPLKSTCQFNNGSVIPGPPPNGTTVQLTFGTASSMQPARPSDRIPWPWETLEISAALAALMAMAIIKWRSTPRRQLAFGTCLATVFFAAVLTGCGVSGGSGYVPSYTGTPKGPATFTVTGTSGATTFSTQVTVTVE
jgi:hypothetical protein